MNTTTMLQSISPDELRELINSAVETANNKRKPEPPTEPEDSVLTRHEAAQFLRISLPTLSRRIKDGTIPVVHVCGRTLVRRQDLIDLLAAASSQSQIKTGDV